MATATTEALVAHLLRRTSFGPFPDRSRSWRSSASRAPSTTCWPRRRSPSARRPTLSDDSTTIRCSWWLQKMARRQAGIHEKMTWFWHGLVTISHDKVFWWNVEWQAHVVLRQYALGSYRPLLKQMTVQPAMLLYLDGDWSTVEGPNENYARELQELFTIGQPNIVQANVSNGALALAGWHVDWENATSDFIDEDWSPARPQGALPGQAGVALQRGRRRGLRPPATCARFRRPASSGTTWWATRLGVQASASLARLPRHRPGRRARWSGASSTTRSSCKKRLNRPRYPIEWVMAAMAAHGHVQQRRPGARPARQMGQVPFYPPSRGRLAGRPALAQPEPDPGARRPRHRVASHPGGRRRRPIRWPPRSPLLASTSLGTDTAALDLAARLGSPTSQACGGAPRPLPRQPGVRPRMKVIDRRQFLQMGLATTAGAVAASALPSGCGRTAAAVRAARRASRGWRARRGVSPPRPR